ncbi:hypothetical protein [Bosea thiooxidans]
MTASQYSQFSLEPSPIVATGTPMEPVIGIGGGAPRQQEGVISDETSSPLATLQTRSGRPTAAHAATDNDLVSVFGSQTTVATAIQMGILQRHPGSGILVETGMTKEQLVGAKPATRAEDGRPAEPQLDQAPALSKSESRFFDVLRAQVPGADRAAAYRAYVEQQPLTDLMVGRIASHLRINPDQAADSLVAAGAALDKQRNRALAGFGIRDLEGFNTWAQQTMPNKVTQARQEHALNGTVAGYRNMAQRYIEQLDKIDTELVLISDYGSGIVPRLKGNGVVLYIPGKGEVPWSVAVATGLVGVRQA